MRVTRIVLWIVCAVYWVALFTLTHLPQAPVIVDGPFSDKVGHALAYGVLAGVLYLALWTSKPLRWRASYFVIAVALLYGAMDELTQPLVGRSCEFLDWLADATGAVLVTGIFGALRGRLEERSRIGGAGVLAAGEGA